jgi:AcrR family transcriptional regulator
MASTAPALWRRAPVQPRGRERVERILDAAGALLDEGGWEALNTNAVAKRAGVPVGSVYQYFDGKDAVARALALRSLERLDAVVAGLMPRGPFDWVRLSDRFVETLARFWREEPGYRGGWLALAGGLREAESALDAELAARVGRLIAEAAPRLAERRRREVAAAIVIVMGPLLSQAARLPEAEARGLEREAKLLVRCRLRLCVEEGQ